LKNRLLYLSLAAILSLFTLRTQAEIKDTATHFTLSGYVDVYYAAYTDSVGIGNYQKFPSISPRSNSFGLNTMQLNMAYEGDKVRAMAVLHYGDIARSAWSSTYNPIMEAHAGVKLCKTLWLDAGFFRTHFGTEYLLPKENFTSSVSVNTYYEPYYESGFRLNYDPTKKLEINIFVLNGYGIYEDNNRKKSLGMGITYALGDKGGIGYTNYIGDDFPDSSRVSHLRVHNNAFINYQVKKLKIQIGGDYCLQANSDTTGKKQATMYSGVASLKYFLTPKYAIYGRYEIFNDQSGIMSSTFHDKANTTTGFKLWGITAGVEYKPTENSYIRLEARQLQNDKNQEIYRWEGKNKSYRQEVMVNFGVSF
jgi:opacity protein-like surface antigen